MPKVHVAGPCLTLDGRYIRQRCSWCGAVLTDYDLDRIAAPVGQDSSPGQWSEGAFVLVDGAFSTVLVDGGMGKLEEQSEGCPLPEHSCMRDEVSG